MKAVKSISYEGRKAVIVYEEDGVVSEYLMTYNGAEWKGESDKLDKFFNPLLKKGE